MQNWCYQYNCYCDVADEHGSCKSTACIKSRNITYEKVNNFDECAKYHVKADDNNWNTAIKTVRECQICGKATESLDLFLCEDCRRKLNNLMEFMK